MRVIALDKFDNRREGEEFECSDRQGQQLIDKGLAKLGPKPKNKMAPTPENKANPTATAGKTKRSSASPAVRVSGQTTAEQYPGGGLVIPDQRLATEEPTSEQANKTGSLL